MVDYPTLVQRLAALLVISDNDDAWSGFVPAIVEAAELRILRDLDPLVQRTYGVSQFFAGGDVAANAVIGTPPDMMICRTVNVFLPSSTEQQRFPLLRRDEGWINDYWPDRSKAGIPAFYALLGADQMLVAPTPAAAFIVEIAYVGRPAMLSQASQQSWVATWYPDLLLYAAAVIGSGYLKNYGAGADDPTQAMSWEARYQDQLSKAQIEERRRRGAEWADHSLAEPPKQTPTE